MISLHNLIVFLAGVDGNMVLNNLMNSGNMGSYKGNLTVPVLAY